MTRRRVLLALAVGAAAALALLLSDEHSDDEGVERAAPPAAAPNLLVVMTDDQTASSFTPVVMPRTHELFADRGTTFEQAIAAPPLCCPARAGFLTGRYAHEHGVVENDVGYETMAGKDTTLPVRLQAGGYRTGMIGKFLNGYERVAGAEPAPGFDRWYSIHGPALYRDFQVSDDGDLHDVAEYATDDLTRAALEFTSEADADGVPFFLWLSYNAPHTVPAGNAPPCDAETAQPRSPDQFERFADASLPEAASFDEADVADKPSLTGGPARLRPGRIATLEQAWRCALASLAAVDDGVGEVVEALRSSGQLERTVIVFLSDNGFYYGEHRLALDKRLPLEPALRIPLAIRVGERVAAEEAPATAEELISQVDLGPTLLDYAGVPDCPPDLRCPPLDGRSLRPLLEGGGWPADRAIPLTLDEGWMYRGLRTPGELYLELTESRWQEFPERAIELYDLDADPNQLTNLAADPDEETRARIAQLGERLDRLVAD